MSDVKRKTVDEITRRIVESGNGKVSVDQAKKIAVDGAERVNRRRRDR